MAPPLPKLKGTSATKSVKPGQSSSAHVPASSEPLAISREGDNVVESAKQGDEAGVSINNVIEQKPAAKTIIEMNTPVVPQGIPKERPKTSGVRMKNVSSPSKRESLSKSELCNVYPLLISLCILLSVTGLQRRPLRNSLVGKKAPEPSVSVVSSLEGSTTLNSTPTEVQDQIVPS